MAAAADSFIRSEIRYKYTDLRILEYTVQLGFVSRPQKQRKKTLDEKYFSRARARGKNLGRDMVERVYFWSL
jgi:hypothetical protein